MRIPRSRYLAVGAFGLVAAVLIRVLDDRDPYVFTIPVLVATAVVLLVLRLSDHRSEERAVRDGDGAEGLRYDGVQPVPSVTPILHGVTTPAAMLAGDLRADGPPVRVTRVRGRLVAITDAPHVTIDAGSRAWLEQQPLRPEAGIEDGLLVVAVPPATSYRELLDLTRALHARL